MRNRLFITAGIALLAVSACGQPVDTASDEAALTAMVEQWDTAVVAGDWDALLSLYVDEPLRLHPDEPIIVGKEAIRAVFQGNRDRNDADFKNEAVDIRVSGDLAVVRGIWSGTFTPRDGSDVYQDSGKWVSVRERQPDGSWKIVYDIWNRDAPPAGNQ
jgi:uncharacterized protein (TIGR02246 family)